MGLAGGLERWPCHRYLSVRGPTALVGEPKLVAALGRRSFTDCRSSGPSTEAQRYLQNRAPGVKRCHVASLAFETFEYFLATSVGGLIRH